MSQTFSEAELDQLFRTARTRNGWRPEPVPETLIRELYDLLKWGPTSANLSPGRFVFLTTEAAKARLAPHLSNANRPKTLAAPVVALVAYDLKFAEHAPRLFPHAPGVKDWFGDPAVAQETAFRNGTLQGAYLILAARALGLDCGPMSGFDAKGVDAVFFADTSWRTNFICNLGYGSEENLFERLPRLPFEEVCRIL
ncbi:malonic semialdehyde reductase [Phenylobacterium sp. LjRoot225]|uniref:malonic semialdehyde reductase n=1 Tax=Phenylobacterium sp. LjRoot225 TaxID=3342285 RepID=UPI003ECE8B09